MGGVAINDSSLTLPSDYDKCRMQLFELIATGTYKLRYTGVSTFLQLAIDSVSGDVSSEYNTLAKIETIIKASVAATNNFTATRKPVLGDDTDDGYSIGSFWYFSNTLYLCIDATAGAAVWIPFVTGSTETDENDKGYYATEALLLAAYPTGTAGWYATVGETDTLWMWSENEEAWVDTGLDSANDLATQVHTATEVSSIVDNDEFAILASASSWALRRIKRKNVSLLTSQITISDVATETLDGLGLVTTQRSVNRSLSSSVLAIQTAISNIVRAFMAVKCDATPYTVTTTATTIELASFITPTDDNILELDTDDDTVSLGLNGVYQVVPYIILVSSGSAEVTATLVIIDDSSSEVLKTVEIVVPTTGYVGVLDSIELDIEDATKVIRFTLESEDDTSLSLRSFVASVFTADDNPLNNFDASAAPTVTDDSDSGYSVGSQWIYSGSSYQCTDAKVGAAVWPLLSSVGVAPAIVAAAAKSTPVDDDLFGIVDSADSNSLKKLTWANLKATLLTYLQGFFTGRVYITPSVSSSTLTFDFNSYKECYANASGGGAIQGSGAITIAYSNATNFKTLWFTFEATAAATLTFPANHISGDSKWDSLVLTLPTGIYQVSIMYDGANYHVACSEEEV